MAIAARINKGKLEEEEKEEEALEKSSRFQFLLLFSLVFFHHSFPIICSLPIFFFPEMQGREGKKTWTPFSKASLKR